MSFTTSFSQGQYIQKILQDDFVREISGELSHYGYYGKVDIEIHEMIGGYSHTIRCMYSPEEMNRRPVSISKSLSGLMPQQLPRTEIRREIARSMADELLHYLANEDYPKIVETDRILELVRRKVNPL